MLRVGGEEHGLAEAGDAGEHRLRFAVECIAAGGAGHRGCQRLSKSPPGLRPTGRVHLGNYFGAVRNWIQLQERYRCFYFVADWHALTTDYADPSKIRQATFDAVADWIAAGMDPAKCTIFLQSEVKQHAELHLLLSMLTPLGWLERVPSFKDQQAKLPDRDLNMYGFLGYPLLQTRCRKRSQRTPSRDGERPSHGFMFGPHPGDPGSGATRRSAGGERGHAGGLLACRPGDRRGGAAR